MLNDKKYWILILIPILILSCATTKKKDKFNTNGIEIPPGIANDIAAKNEDSQNAKTKGIVTLHVVGRGIAPDNAISKGQALILGQNAARADGYVKLAEKIHGVFIDSYRRVGKGIVDIEVVHQETQALLRGAEVLEYRKDENGVYEAYMRVRIIVNQDSALFPLSS